MLRKRVTIAIFALGILLPISFVDAGTILNSYKYAWSNNSGYINFKNVIVGNSSLSGYAWSENHGLIKFDPARGGVLNNGSGNLSGFAWGEQLGWIDFDGVSISPTTGKFSGTAVGALVGTINFDCPNYCDVRTDWAQSQAIIPNENPLSPPLSGSRSDGGQIANMSHVDSYDEPLSISPQQSGTLKKGTDAGSISLDVPVGAISNKTIFIINEEVLDSDNNFLVLHGTELVNGIFYNIYAVDENSIYVHYFNKPITIVLPISPDQRGNKNLRLYWLNETNNKWTLIPNAVFTNDNVTFDVNHLTKFAIFELENEILQKSTSQDLSINLSIDKKIVSTSTSLKIENNIQNEIINQKSNQSNRTIWTWVFLLVIIISIYLVKKKSK